MPKSAYLYRMAEGWLLGLLILLASSCQEDSIPTYSGGARIQWLTKFVDDSLRVDFSFTQLTDGATQAVVELPFKVIGPTADHDRAFSLRQVDDEGDNAAGLSPAGTVVCRKRKTGWYRACDIDAYTGSRPRDTPSGTGICYRW